MKHMHFVSVGLLALGSLAIGCNSTETESSSNIKTAGIAATIEVIATSETSSTVEATLQVGGDESNVYVNLENGDTLTAAAAGEEKTMSKVDDGEYKATFGTGAGGTEFTVKLDRPDDTDAPNNKGVLPAAFTVTEVPSNQPSRAADDITIKWDNAEPGQMIVEFDGDCIYKKTVELSQAVSEYTLPAGTLESTAVKAEDDEPCEITVKLTRSFSGTTDPNLNSESSFVLRQVRAAAFMSAP